MSKHTPGPWTINYRTDITGKENDPSIGCVGHVDVAHVYLRTVPGKTEANASLIAAAPELLEALKETESRLSLIIDRDQHRLLDIVARDSARAAIAKATGQQGGAS